MGPGVMPGNVTESANDIGMPSALMQNIAEIIFIAFLRLHPAEGPGNSRQSDNRLTLSTL